jgi:hypothetical protein
MPPQSGAGALEQLHVPGAVNGKKADNVAPQRLSAHGLVRQARQSAVPFAFLAVDRDSRLVPAANWVTEPAPRPVPGVGGTPPVL